jgi:hypothetical protein
LEYLGNEFPDKLISHKNFNTIVLTLKARALNVDVANLNNSICIDKGILDLSTNEIMPFDNRFKFTYNFGAVGNSQKVKDYLAVTVDDPDKLGYFVGSCLFRHNLFGKCLFLLGEKGTGKTKICEMILSLLENHSNVNMSKNNLGEFYKYSLLDSDINFCDDVIISNLIANELQELITGNHKMTINPKNRDTFLAYIWAKFIFTSNFNPKFNEYSIGMERRTLIVNTIRCENLPPFPSKEDWVAFAIEYAADLLKHDFKIDFPENIALIDPIGDFLNTITFPVPLLGFYDYFNDFFEKTYGIGSKIPSLREFNADIKNRGYVRKTQRIKGVVTFCWF